MPESKSKRKSESAKRKTEGIEGCERKKSDLANSSIMEGNVISLRSEDLAMCVLHCVMAQPFGFLP